MFKIIGAFCIMIGCSYLGLKKSSQYQKRSELFVFLQNALALLETEISYMATPLPHALQRIGKKVTGVCQPLFKQTAVLLTENNGMSVNEAWEEGIKSLMQEVFLTPEEKEILFIFGRGLGRSTKEDQIKNITLTRQQLSLMGEMAKAEQIKNQKMWRYLGFSCGLLLILIFL